MRHHELPELTSQPLTPEFLSSQDCLLIATDHSAFDYEQIVRHGRLVLHRHGPHLPGSARLAARTDATGHDFPAEE